MKLLTVICSALTFGTENNCPTIWSRAERFLESRDPRRRHALYIGYGRRRLRRQDSWRFRGRSETGLGQPWRRPQSSENVARRRRERASLLTDAATFERMNAVYKTYFNDPRPTRTTVVVAKLVGQGRIEITATARK